MKISPNSVLRPLQKSSVKPAVGSLSQQPISEELKDTYLFSREKADGAQSWADQVRQLKSQAASFEVPSSLSAARTPREALQRYSQQKANFSPQQVEALEGWVEAQGDLLLLQETPYRTADGVTRTADLYTSPGALQIRAEKEGWEIDSPTGLPLVDAVVVGGGPGGLATGFQLREHGQNVVLFEAGHVGQAFSDAGATPTHFMRTGGATNSLVHYRELKKTWDHPLSLFENARDYHGMANQAGQEFESATGLGPLTSGERSLRDGERRSVFFQHMAHMATDLAHSEGCSVIEHSRVKPPRRRPDGLWEVETEMGHKVVSRNLVLATGQVGESGSAARMTPQMEALAEENPGRYLVLRSDGDLWQKTAPLAAHLESLKGEDQNHSTLIASDRLLGQQPIQLALARMEPGKRVAVIGGGESAAKAALEVIRQNPELKVDLYTNKKLLPSQLQIPQQDVGFGVWGSQAFEGSYGEKSLGRLKKFGTPVSPHAVKELFELEAEGKVRIREMGERFDENSIELVPGADGKTRVRLLSQEARDQLMDSRGELEASGLYPPTQALGDPTELPDADMFIVATGYDSAKNTANPFFEGLQEQGALELDQRGRPQLDQRGIASGVDPSLFLVTAGAVSKSSDTTIPGNRGRAMKVAETVAGVAELDPEIQYAGLEPIGATPEQAQHWKQRVLGELKKEEPSERESSRVWNNEQMIFHATRSLPTINMHAWADAGDLNSVEQLVYTRALELESHMREQFGVEQVSRQDLKDYLSES